MSCKRHWKLISVIAVLFLLGGFCWFIRPEPAFDIGGGWKARLWEADVGELSRPFQSHLVRDLLRFAPRGLQKRMYTKDGCYVHRDDDQLIIAFQVIPPDNEDYDNMSVSPEVPFRPDIEIVDSQGRVYRHPEVGCKICGQQGYAIVLPHDTAHEPELHLRVIDPKTKSIWVERVVPNPVFGNK